MFSEKWKHSYKKRLILRLAFFLFLFVPTIVIAQPNDGVLPVSVPVLVDHPVEQKLPVGVLSNCFAYVKMVYPELPNTAVILESLGSAGEVAVFYYPDSGLYHYAVVESVDPFIVTDTNYGSATKKTREETGRNLIGFYSLR